MRHFLTNYNSTSMMGQVKGVMGSQYLLQVIGLTIIMYVILGSQYVDLIILWYN